MTTRLEGKVSVVTGAGGGLGSAIARRFAENGAAVVVHDVPLLAETANAASRGYAAVLVVEAPRELRLERLEGRGVPRADAEAQMATQATDEMRREIATHVIDNGADREALAAIVDEVWADLLELREERTATEATEAAAGPASDEAAPA